MVYTAITKLIPGLKHVHIVRRFWCNFLAAAFAFTILSPITYLLADRTPPFILKDGITIPSVITSNSTFQIQWTVIPIRQGCTGWVYAEIIDSQNKITEFDATPSFFNPEVRKGPDRFAGRERNMPSSVAAGPIEIRVRNVWYCNWIQEYLRWPNWRTWPPVTAQVIKSTE